jgi:hypothetical protein
MKKILLLLLASGLMSAITAQPDFGLHFMRNTWQSSLTNPALLSTKGVTVALPSFSNSIILSGPAFGDFLTENDQGETTFDVDHVLAHLEDRNLLRENLQIETFGAAFGIGPLRFSLHHALRFGAYFEYPRELPELVWNGNAQFIGQTIDLTNDLQINGYNEFGLGAAFKFWKLTAGLRAKLLTGIGDVSTDRHAASLHTSDDVYQLTFTGDYRANTSAYLDYNGFDDFRADIHFGDFDFDQLFARNLGFSADLGLLLELDKLHLAASVIDIGRIRWSENPRNYSSQGTFSYDGLDISGVLTGDSVSIGDALDTLQSIFEVTETNFEYSTSLPARYYLSATYDLTSFLQLGGMFYRETYRGERFNGFAFSARARAGKWFAGGLTYSIFRESYFNLGINTVFTLGPVQLLAATDNLVAVISPDRADFANMRLGLNLVFGK